MATREPSLPTAVRSRANSLSPSQTRRRRQRSTTPATSSPRATRSSKKGSSARRATLAPALLIACSLLLAACGGDETSTQETAEVTNSAPPPPKSGDGPAETGDGDGGVELTEIGSFDSPVYVTQPPGEDEDLYVVEQGGTIQRLSPDGETETFLDITDQVVSGGEQGLLSVAFAPDYEKSGLFYVYFTDLEEDQRIVEFTAADGVVDEESRRDVLRMDDLYPNHNGGLLLFGPDDLLYVGTGDVGGADDPERNAQDRTSLLGKLLRIDPAQSGDDPYSVPADNPFAGDESARGEVYSYGLRNPWRFSFDPETDTLAIGDVGQEEQEEVDIVAAGKGSGANFGWSAFEGDEPFNEDQGTPESVPPVLVATHADGNCSITGGVVVRDRDLPSLYGRYLWADFCLGELQSFTAEPGRRADDNRPLGLDVESPSSFGTDGEGNVYAVSISGPVYRLDPAS